jgi:ABC-type transport system involved in cytochrome bd biosynthesis fused ATPase/permease subunit
VDGRIAGTLATLIMVVYVGFLAWSTGSLALGIIVLVTVALALIDLFQTEYQRREDSIRRG